jgi:hypothetical protein
MRSWLARKKVILLLAIMGLLAISVLASGLREVAFLPGQIMAEEEAEAVSVPLQTIVQNINSIPLWKQLVAWGIIFLIVLIMSLILSREMRIRVLKMFLRFSLIIAGLYFVARRFPEVFRGLGLFRPESAGNVDTAAQEGLPPPVFEPPEMSPATFYLVGLAVALVLAILFWAGRRWWLRRQEYLARRAPLDELAGIARESLEKISAGSAWDDVIIDSYVRMYQVVEKRKGLIRQHAVTPSEYANTLARAGLPAEAVQTLTRLFESVRYGARRSSRDEIDQAVACLTDILKYCGETV